MTSAMRRSSGRGTRFAGFIEGNVRMHKYKVRPGYQSRKLLIEFAGDETQVFADLMATLKGARGEQ